MRNGKILQWYNVMAVNGRKVLSDLTGVAKAGNDRHTVHQRLTINVKLSNWNQNVFSSDTPHLTSNGHWRCFGFGEGHDRVSPLLSCKGFGELS